MPEIVCKGHVNSAGGKALVGDKTFIIEKRPVSPITTAVTGHKKEHPHRPTGSPKTHEGVKSFIVTKKKAVHKGHHDTCNHPRVEGIKSFIIKDK